MVPPEPAVVQIKPKPATRQERLAAQARAAQERQDQIRRQWLAQRERWLSQREQRLSQPNPTKELAEARARMMADRKHRWDRSNRFA